MRGGKVKVSGSTTVSHKSARKARRKAAAKDPSRRGATHVFKNKPGTPIRTKDISDGPVHRGNAKARSVQARAGGKTAGQRRAGEASRNIGTTRRQIQSGKLKGKDKASTVARIKRRRKR